AWQRVADGRQAARITISSGGAAAVRAGLVLANAPSDVMLRFAGSAHPEDEFGPFSAIEIATAQASGDLYWSPVLEGGTGTIEIVAPAGIDTRSLFLRIPKIAHLLVAGAALRNSGAA